MREVESKTAAPVKPFGLDMRDAFFDALYDLAVDDRKLVLITDDQGAFSLEKFKKDLRCQYINAGIAEQNIVSVATGLALGGKRPFLYGICTFMTMRCYEQIRLDLCCMNLPVTIVGSGPGFTYGSDGPTHHATQDLAIMRALPEITVLNPSDDVMTAASVRLAHRNSGPTYVRLEKGVFPRLYDDVGHDFSEGYHVLLDGRELMIVSTGIMVHHALRVADELSNHSVDAGVIDLYRIKPVNSQSLLPAIERTQRLVTLEESSIIGGLGSLVAELLIDAGKTIPLKRLAVPDQHVYRYGPREWLHSEYGLDVDSLAEVILKWLRAG
jgi:transketolase